MKNRNVILGLTQTAPGQDPGNNLAMTVGLVKEAIRKGAQIICLPELYRNQYFPQYIGRDYSGYAETIPGESTRIFSEIASAYKVVIVLPLYARSGNDKYQNAVVVIDADGTLFPPYYKVHIPQDPFFFEKGYFFQGDHYQACNTRFAVIAPLICYDQWFPEPARIAALQGAEIILYPTAIGDVIPNPPPEGEWRDAWETVQRSHAIANSLHVAAVNRVGTEDGIRFFGGSFVADAFGTVLVRAGAEEEVVICEVDLAMNHLIRESWGFMRNRRPETYHLLCEPLRGEEYDKPPVIRGDTPRNRGYHMPAEWERHEAVWLSWPHNILTFPYLEAVEKSYIRFIAAIHRSEEVRLLVPEDQENRVIHLLGEAGVDLKRVTVYHYPYADVWIRDYGPTFVVNRGEGRVAMVRWIFNAWGDKYDELLKDGNIPGYMGQDLGYPVFQPGIVLEGGSIDVNGRGTVLTTRACLLHPNRNPSLSPDEIEETLLEYLGAVKVIWLHDGVAGDDTDGHIDDIARFVGPSTVVCACEEDPADENYQVLLENYHILSGETDQDGNPLTVVRLPMPGPVITEGMRYPASYTNFYIGNSMVIVPVFGDPNDERAVAILKGVFPGREVIGINARAMIEGYGTFHCATQQQPAMKN
jgi:agmatine deiminase